MKICNNNHNEIVHNLDECPLCKLTEHNNKVHDFIENLGYTNKLVTYLDAYHKSKYNFKYLIDKDLTLICYTTEDRLKFKKILSDSGFVYNDIYNEFDRGYFYFSKQCNYFYSLSSKPVYGITFEDWLGLSKLSC